MSLVRLFHTLRWMRGRQLAAQLRHRLGGALPRTARAAEAAPAWPGCVWTPCGEFLPPGPQDNAAESLRAGRFAFLRRSESLGWPPRWDAPGLPRLWQYNLHYFEYLWALPWEDGRALALDWIARHQPGRGQVGWEPYPLSLRLQNWCGYFFGRHRERSEADAELKARLWPSLYRQAQTLSRAPERHLGGNHLLENAAALACCGACFGGPGQAWLRQGLAILEQELPEQMLADGGHFERSPMYHLRATALLAGLANTGNAALRSRVEPPLGRARQALAHLVHPDGAIALLNDSAFGIANRPAELAPPAARPGVFSLPDTGYYGARSAEGHYLVCDAAPVGPDYLPGHAHGDLLSFELSLQGQRVLVDAGVYDYEVGEMRRYCRSTAAHNTVEVEGRDQCEFWAAFRVARRGRPRDVRFREEAGGFALEAWHDGYERLPGRPRHERRFRWHPEGLLLVRDRVVAQRAVAQRSRLHLHPDCEIVGREAHQVRLSHPGGQATLCFAGPGELSLESGFYCPEFGLRRENQALVYTAHGADVETGFCVANGGGALGYDLAAGAHWDGARYPW